MTAREAEYPVAQRLALPLAAYSASGYVFRSRVRSRIIFIARHLGDDVLCDAGTPVHAAGDGHVVLSEVRPATRERRNWGGVVIIGHNHRKTNEPFHTIYGHMTDLAFSQGDTVNMGDQIGTVAPGGTPANGGWKQSHLHFGIYVGPWMGHILPGWQRPFEGRTHVRWWRDPVPYIQSYNVAQRGE